ncbi:MAG: adenylate/guanylate cyclase domain-containing protein [Saprospiraceae bacterium]
MTTKKNSYIIYWLLFCLANLSFTTTWEKMPLDSVKQVLRDLNIPYNIQEDWVEELEELENRQDSRQFKLLLTKVDRQLKAYLVDKDSYVKENTEKKSTKNKLKQRFNKFEKGIAKTVSQGVNFSETTILLGKGLKAEGKNNYAEAIHHYKKAVKGLAAQKKWENWIETQEKVADLMVRLRDYDGALEILPLVKDKMRDLQDGAGMQRITTRIRNLQKNLKLTVAKEAPPINLPEPAATVPPVVPATKPTATPTPKVSDIAAQIEIQKRQLAQEQAAIAAREREMEDAAKRLEEAERNKDYKKIAALNRKVRALEKKSKADKAAVSEAENALNEKKVLLLEKEAELSKKAANQLKLYGGLAALATLFFFTFLMYRGKKKDHKKLAVAYDELEAAQKELKIAEQKIKGLLDQQVSGAVAAELLAENKAGVAKHERRFVCVMFLDIRNFTPFVESKTPEEIIEYQNNVLGFMMEKVIEHGGIVNTVLGDGFMATFGAPISAGNDCLQAYKAAVEIMQMVREKSRTRQIPPTKIGIGMHAGNVVAGNVGTKTRKQYLVTGNTVIIASRLEQLNKQYGSSLIISREVVERLPNAMNLPKVFDKVMVKGRSKPVEIAKYG